MADIYLAPISSPCKDCPNRSFACHDSCCLYQDYKEQLTEYKERRVKSILFNRPSTTSPRGKENYYVPK